MAKENHFTLELPACSAEDSGQYTCRVSDAAGSANITCSAQLEVHQRERLSAEVIRNQVCGLTTLYNEFVDRISVSAAERQEREASNHPVFISKLKDSEMLKESTSSFMLHVKGNPNPEMKL